MADRCGQRDQGGGHRLGVTVLGLSVVALTMAFRRWRHLLVFMGSLFFLEIVGTWIYDGAVQATPVWRADHRQLGRVLGRRPRWRSSRSS